jgi:hypothetical protein
MMNWFYKNDCLDVFSSHQSITQRLSSCNLSPEMIGSKPSGNHQIWSSIRESYLMVNRNHVCRAPGRTVRQCGQGNAHPGLDPIRQTWDGRQEMPEFLP